VANKTLKIGFVAFLEWPMGQSVRHELLRTEMMVNKLGGLKIGQDIYDLQFIICDSHRTSEGEKEAITKLVSTDKVKYIIAAEEYFVEEWLPFTEKNAVIVNGGSPNPYTLSPQFNYSFNSSASDTSHCVMIGWYKNNFKEKSAVMAALCPDDHVGHLTAQIHGMIWESFGTKTNYIYYPKDQTEFSDFAARIAEINPGTFTAVGGGLDRDAKVYRAVWDAGYRGQFFAPGGLSEPDLRKALPSEALEGFISGGFPANYKLTPTEYTRKFHQEYIDKYGELPDEWHGAWGSPDNNMFDCLRAAMQQCGSIDTDIVAETISNGLKFESTHHTFQMINRPDLGNYRTIDATGTYYLKQIKEGKQTLLAKIETGEAVKYARHSYQPKEQ